MRGNAAHVCGCFPTGRHYAGIADRIAKSVERVVGLAQEFAPDANWAKSALAVIDFETTGLDPEQDRVLEMGIVHFDDGVLSARHNFLMNPGIPIPEESRAVHGITDEELEGAPRFEKIADDLLGHLQGRIPVAYNADFDKQFLLAEFARIKRPIHGKLPPAVRKDTVWVDPLVWVRELHRDQKGHKLVDVCERLGIDLDNAHRASDDAEATGRVLLRLAQDMPETYSELVRIQSRYAAQQDAERPAWRRR